MKPNKLDFDVVFFELTRLHETGNIAVMSILTAVVMMYFVVVIFARRADKRDKSKVRVKTFSCPITQISSR